MTNLTNTQILDAAMQLFIATTYGKQYSSEGKVTSPEQLVSYLESVETFLRAVAVKLIQDDRISEWELEQRMDRALEIFGIPREESGNETAH